MLREERKSVWRTEDNKDREGEKTKNTENTREKPSQHAVYTTMQCIMILHVDQITLAQTVRRRERVCVCVVFGKWQRQKGRTEGKKKKEERETLRNLFNKASNSLYTTLKWMLILFVEHMTTLWSDSREKVCVRTEDNMTEKERIEGTKKMNRKEKRDKHWKT